MTATDTELAMARVPPIPPANKSPKGPKNQKKADLRDQASDTRHGSQNADHNAQQANIEQNTTNQGYQQDR
jgi:hypothetical protein